MYKHTKQLIILILGLTILAQNTYSQKSGNSDSIYVIVGSFKNQYNAIYLKRDLRKKGFKNAVSLNRKNGFYRVSIERFNEIKEAKKFIEENQLKKSEFWYQYSNGQVINNYNEKPNKISTETLTRLDKKLDKEDQTEGPFKESHFGLATPLLLATEHRLQCERARRIGIVDQ